MPDGQSSPRTGVPVGEPVEPKVWDIGVRVFHWTLVADVLGLWLTARAENFDLHFKLGYLALGLLLFRLIWGVVGGDTARFATFIKGPGAVLAHLGHLLRPGPLPPHRGHNAAGGWAVVALLLAVLAQVATGLCAVDADGMNEGPLAARVGDAGAKVARRLHHANFTLLEGVVLLHVTAIVLYLLLKRENLLYPMITGRAFPGLAFRGRAFRGRAFRGAGKGAAAAAAMMSPGVLVPRLLAAVLAAAGLVGLLLWLA